jgi:hypothetical protein
MDPQLGPTLAHAIDNAARTATSDGPNSALRFERDWRLPSENLAMCFPSHKQEEIGMPDDAMASAFDSEYPSRDPHPARKAAHIRRTLAMGEPIVAKGAGFGPFIPARSSLRSTFRCDSATSAIQDNRDEC